MESFGGPGMVVVGNGVRKKRTDSSRKRRHDSNALLQSNIALPGSTQLLVNSVRCRDEDHNDGDNKVVVVVSEGLRKLKKLKLKVGGITRTIHTKPKGDFGTEIGSSSIAFKAQQNPILQEEMDKTKPLGVKFKNLPKPDLTSHMEQVRKSNRVPKRRALDIGFDKDEVDQTDDEIRFLEKLKNPKTHINIEDSYQRKRERVVFKAVPKSRVVSDFLYDEAVGKKSKLKSEDIDYVGEEEEEEEQMFDGKHGSSMKKLKKESTPTTRSMQSISGSVEPLNLLPINSKKKKEKLSEVEQQLKKAEAAQRRKIQSEKAAREAEAEAIRKILGQDSVRKKKEEKMKKQRDELLQERAANFRTLAANTVRWVNGPTGTIVTFSQDIGLPSIFNPAPCSYPPAREKCVGPNCKNSYKYRDAKSNLPLCSLRCYKSIVERNVQHHLFTC